MDLTNLVTDSDKMVLHELSHLAPRINHKWVKLTPSLPPEIKGKYCSLFRDVGKFIELMDRLGK